MNERIALNHERRLEELERRIKKIEQQGYQNGGGNNNSSSSDGAYYCDPGSTVIESGGSEELTVNEILSSGDTDLGTRTVLNIYPDDTEANKRLMLNKCRDGSFVVITQACSASGG